MNYFYENYFAPQNVAPDNKIFSPEHVLLSSLIALGIAFVMHWQIIRKDRGFSRRLVVVLAAVMLGLEIFRIGWHTYYYGLDLRNIRFDWCNQICLALPVIVLFNLKGAYPYVDILAIMGGLAVLIYPLWVFYDYGGIHVMAIQSMISHGLMVLIALTLPFSSDYRPEARYFYKPVIGLIIIAAVALVMSRLLGENYLLMRDAKGLPVIGDIPFPWYWLVVAPLFLGVIRLVTKGAERFSQHFLGDDEALVEAEEQVSC
ncbi:MAG: YwaF family protein [Eubacterium sp.]|nr:YwaF family protein [Eubacterium sp.]